MCRSQRQKLNGWEWDWVEMYTRRVFGYNRRPGLGKFLKRKMSRRLRRLPVERDDE